LDDDRRSDPSALPASRVPGLAARRRREVLARTADAPRPPIAVAERSKVRSSGGIPGHMAGPPAVGRRLEAGGVVQDAGREIEESGGMTPRFLPAPLAGLEPATCCLGNGSAHPICQSPDLLASRDCERKLLGRQRGGVDVGERLTPTTGWHLQAWPIQTSGYISQ
jgi:hypothetical protein